MRRIWLLLFLAVAVAGCASDDADPPETAPATPVAESFPARLIGEYEREVTEADIARTEDHRVEGPGQEPPEAGLHRMVVNEGVMQVYLPPDDFEISQQLTITDQAWEIGPYTGGEGVFCAEDGPASYTWTLERDGFVLTVQNDPCADRESTLVGTWQKTG